MVMRNRCDADAGVTERRRPDATTPVEGQAHPSEVTGAGRSRPLYVFCRLVLGSF